MVVCKFYLQGTCKFGTNCKFEHDVSATASSNSVSIMRQNAPTSTGNVPDFNMVVRSVQTDMLNSEKGGQWLLSSYTPFKEKPVFPGFEDKSFEEVRLGFYEATKNGTVEQYKQQLQGFLQETVMKIRALQNPSQEMVNFLKQIYDTPPQTNPSVFTNQNAFSNQTSTGNSSVFGGSVFASANQQTSTFNSNSPFNTQTSTNSPFNTQMAGNSPFNPQTTANSPFGGQTTTNSLFNKQTANTPFSSGGNSPFGMQNSSSPFAAQAENTSPFTAVQQQMGGFGNQANASSPFSQFTQNPSPFAQVQNQGLARSPLAAQNVSPFLQVQNASSFAQTSATSTQAQAVSPFAQVQKASPFAQVQAAPQSNSPFTQVQIPPAFTQNPSPFSSQPQAQSVPPFGTETFPSGLQPSLGQTQQKTAQNSEIPSPFVQVGQNQNAATQPQNTSSQTGSIFGSSQNTVVNVFGGQAPNVANADAELYTKIADLSEQDLEAFRGESFRMGSIPENPPPVDLCF